METETTKLKTKKMNLQINFVNLGAVVRMGMEKERSSILGFGNFVDGKLILAGTCEGLIWWSFLLCSLLWLEHGALSAALTGYRTMFPLFYILRKITNESYTSEALRNTSFPADIC
uniref:Uncharacterized protein n=1 Tax=Solanum lycopersicum TaxID=4081 RepID=A0A3Q7HBR9_SOLLC